MVQELVNLFPREPGTIGLIVAISGTVIGAIFWMLGAKLSRWVITLLTVMIGGAVGMKMPEWFGWQISGAGPAVGAALVLGVTGFVIHGVWVGIGFGAVLCSWAAIACWMIFRNGAELTWPAIDKDTAVVSYLVAVWQSLPPEVTRIMPFACAAAMVTGLAVTIIWPRMGLILGWAMAGTMLLVGMGVATTNLMKPDLLGQVPSPTWAQGTLLAAFVAISALFQWRLGPKPAKAKSGKKKTDDLDDDDSNDMDDD